MSPRRKPTVDLIIPVYNEAGVITQMHARFRAVVDALPYSVSFIYVDDGSSDATEAELNQIASADKRARIIPLSRNFGHQAALTAGLDASTADMIVSLDADGQHPPEMIPQMLDLIAQGYDIVQGQRAEDAELGRFKKWTSSLFYRVLNFISGTRVLPGAADFRAMSRRAADALKAMPEYHRFLRGMVSWIGFKTAILPYHQQERSAGVSKYSFGKMFRLAMDAIFSFSLAPLYIGLSFGGIFFFLALAEMLYALSFWLTGKTDQLAPGWSSLMFMLLIIGGLVMILLGFIGVYVGYIFQEVKRRPVYIIKETPNHD
ncbi:MAG: putative glycosyltransferase [Anaerolineales bacterium]|nr:putative glycosyltransferase [Anaerolineales bacterium]